MSSHQVSKPAPGAPGTLRPNSRSLIVVVVVVVVVVVAASPPSV